MKTKLSKIIGSAVLATGIAVSFVATPAQAVKPPDTGKPPDKGKPADPVVPVVPTPSFTLLNTQNFNFGNILGGDTVGDTIVNQFNFNVSKTSTNQVLFQIFNTGEKSDAFISQVKFSDANNLLKFNAFAPDYNVVNTALGNNNSVNFAAENKNLAQSNNIRGWVDSYGFAATSPGANKAGVDQKEALGLLFDGDFNSVISGLTSNQLTVGMHVQGIGIANGASDTFISGNPENVKVPEPATLAGLGLAFGGMLASRRRQAH